MLTLPCDSLSASTLMLSRLLVCVICGNECRCWNVGDVPMVRLLYYKVHHVWCSHRPRNTRIASLVVSNSFSLRYGSLHTVVSLTLSSGDPLYVRCPSLAKSWSEDTIFLRSLLDVPPLRMKRLQSNRFMRAINRLPPAGDA